LARKEGSRVDRPIVKNVLADTCMREYAGSAHQQAVTVEVTATAPDLEKRLGLFVAKTSQGFAHDVN
jgi:hypothetical protein